MLVFYSVSSLNLDLSRYPLVIIKGVIPKDILISKLALNLVISRKLT